MTTTNILAKAGASRWAIAITMMLFLVQAMTAFADDAKISTDKDKISISKANGGIEFNLYLLENSGDRSYWRDNPEIWIDGVKICTLSDLGLPILQNNNAAKLDDELNRVKAQEGVHKVFKYNDFISVGSYDPRYKKESKEYWVTIGITLGYNVEGGNHHIEVRGNWADNINKQYSGRKTLSFNTNEYRTGDFPASAGTTKRENGKIVWTATGLKQDKDYRYAFSLQKTDSHKKAFEDRDIPLWAYMQAELNAQEYTNSFEADNYEPYTIYPRIITQKATGDAVWFDNKMKSTMTFRKDYKEVIVKGFPRAARVTATTTDAYSKKTKISWETEVKNAKQADTKGRWYIFRKKKGENTYTKLSDVAYSTRSYNDNDTEKEYFDTSNGDDTQYEYTVCFVPDGWTVNVPEDAKGLYATTDYKMTRTFAISDLGVEESSTGVTINWSISSITNASSSNKYTLKVQRSKDEGGSWEDLKEESITSSSKTSGSYTDSKDLKVYENYLYRVTINVQGRDYESNRVSAGLTGGTSVKDFTASRGTYSKSVKMQWSVDQVGSEPTYFQLQRRPLGSTDIDDWKDIYTTNGTSSLYSYEDEAVNPGSYYEYHLRIWLNRDGVQKGIRDYYTDGFGLATGVLSGRVYYDSGTSVEGVKVSLKPSEANGESLSKFRSLYIEDVPNAGIRYVGAKGTLKKLLGKDYAVQLYVAPDSAKMNGSQPYALLSISNTLELNLQYNKADGDYTLYQGTQPTSLRLPANGWSHISVVKSGNENIFYLNGQDSVQTARLAASGKAIADEDTVIVLGNSVTQNATSHFVGNVDEFRLFSKAISEDNIKQNYSHTLAGTEDGLAIYWPMDEDLASQTLVYDYSKTGDASNARIGRISVPAPSSTYIPTEDQLSLSAYTDKDGNFMVRGIPFSGEGTNYIATPTMGIHKFSPSSVSCYVSLNSLVFSGQNFTDVSSFPVSGRVRYANTTIPVEGAYIYVDGTPASKDGEMIMTDKEGNYTVDVPIGDHFITTKLTDHTFTNEGRYPADPDKAGLKHTFESAMSNVDFFDETTVVVAGRVSGGKTENAKPLGVNASVANIGKAVITLDFKDDPNRAEYIHAKRVDNGTAFYYEQDKSRRDFTTAQGTSKAYVPEDKNYIQIETDSVTGEFAVNLPPLRYTTTSVRIPSQTDITFTSQTIDATNASMHYTDSTTNEYGEELSFTYNTSAKFNYRAPSTLDIIENANGAYGADTVVVIDINGDKEHIPAYTMNADSTINYAFGYPLYEQAVDYQYDINAYERYVNRDDKKEVVYIDPLADINVTIKNQYAASTSVMLNDGTIHEVADDKFTLDSIGHATYSFTAGIPNIQAPYTRTLNASYEVDGQTIEWNKKIEAVVLGGLTNGNDFTTEGPDEVFMVLRDPPGSLSRTVYAKGTEFTTKTTLSQHAAQKLKTVQTFVTGMQAEQGAGGIGFLWITLQKVTSKASGGFQSLINYAHSDTKATTTTLTEQIATSSSPTFVGAVGDVFVGSAKNILVGTSRVVKVKKDEASGKYSLTMEEMLSTGEEFTTAFNYTAWQVENKIIPDFIKLRNSLLKQADSIGNVRQPAAGEQPIYISKVPPTHELYGSDNDDPRWGAQAVDSRDNNNGVYDGPSYKVILPADYKKKTYQDMVKHYNTQVSAWKQQLANNEMAKVQAIENRDEYLDKNYSFDSGASVTVTHNSRKTHDASHSLTTDLSLFTSEDLESVVAGGTVIGADLRITKSYTGGATEVWANTEAETKSISYTLQENDLGETLSVDVFDAPDGFGPVFYTRAGATSNPYEDQVVTKYYKPGTVIQEKTLQVEKPEIEVIDPIVTGVPAGSAATFRVKLRNNSETKKAVTYGLTVMAGKNPNGAQVYMDGRIVNNGINILLPYGEMTKTLTLRQSDKEVMDYKDIPLRLYSPSQPNDFGTFPGIYSDGTVTVNFQPSCSDIALQASTSVVNTENSSTPLVLSISGYDHSMSSLRGVRLEYKGANDADFRTLQEYRKDTTEVKADKNLLVLPALVGGNKLNYSLDMTDRSFSDQTYVFRAVTICNQNGTEVNNESDEIKVVRDLSIPQLIATPSPAAGILNPGDDISITFNEDIANGSLTSDGNFVVMGQLNDRKVTHETALALESGAKAKTQATIDLNMQSFSTDMWLNYSTDGRLFYHGVPTYGLSADIEGGKLALTFDKTKVVSTETLPKDKWLYLHISYDNTGTTPLVSASYAQDDKTVRLINQEPVRVYCGNGPLTLGGGTLVGKVQELAFWSTPRTMDEAQADMYKVKNVFTDALIGYWPLDEGHGIKTEDKARARNITLPGENAWWISAENYAVELDGNTALKANIASATTTASESYLLEAWFRADKEQNGDAAILSVGDSLLSIGINTSGQLTLMANKETNTVATADLRDANWHHIALNVLKSTKGSATIYLDGNSVRQLSASAVPAFQSDALIIGGHRSVDGGITLYDRFLKGAVDEIRLWKGRRTAEVIREMMYTRVDTTSEGLAAYYPMEASRLDGNNQAVTSGSDKDATGKATSGLEAIHGQAGGSTQLAYTNASTPPLTARKTMENVAFSFVASERTVKVNLDELPSRLEGCNVYVTAKNIRDLHGNSMQQTTWSVYVNQSTLKWDDNNVSISKNAKETAIRDLTIRNIGGQTEQFNIIGYPSWLSIDKTEGTLQPLSEQNVKFTLKPGLAIGTYETTVWLTGKQNIELPLHLTVKVEGERPDWQAEEGENTMNVIGQLNVDGIISSDSSDLVAAFIDDRCVGVASPEYYDRYDSYIVLLNVYGNTEDNNKPLTYKAYDASTGRTYPLVDASIDTAKEFVADTWAGIFRQPVIFTPTDKVQQELSRDKAGWMWLSLYVKPEQDTPQSIFGNAISSISLISDGQKSAKWDNSGTMIGNLNKMTNSNMYKVNVKEAYKTVVNGQSINPETVSIWLNSKWTWIGYPVADVNTLDAAFADAHPLNGDIVKSQTQFAMYSDGRWDGKLTSMVPGQGYYYYSQSTGPKTFYFPNVTRQSAKAKRNMAVPVEADDSATDYVAPGYENNMTMVAAVCDGDHQLSGSTVEVYGGDNTLRTRSIADADGLHFLTIGGGNESELLTFVITADGKTKTLKQKTQYSPNAHYGSPTEPHVLQIGTATGISDVEVDGNIAKVELFTTSGNIVLRRDRQLTDKDTANLQVGVYVMRTVYNDGSVETKKITIK